MRQLTDDWARDREIVGRAAHEGWKRLKIENGYAGHEFKTSTPPGALLWECSTCRLMYGNGRMFDYEHHLKEMVEWEKLPDLLKEEYIRAGGIGYMMGYNARSSLDD